MVSVSGVPMGNDEAKVNSTVVDEVKEATEGFPIPLLIE